jgi:Ca2+-transporting ATPase
LTQVEAAQRLAAQGPNELRQAAPVPAWRVFVRQFEGKLVWLLGAACVVSALLGEWVDAGAIGAIVVLNALVGFFQEHRAERAVLALRAMTAPRARVMRDGQARVIPARELVVGDHLLLEAGDIVGADARLLEAHALAANEAPLTGESAHASKSPEPVAEDAPLAERRDRVFMGTSIAAGTGLAQVEGVGMQTELGRIANLLDKVEEDETPLQKRLAKVSQLLVWLGLGVVGVVALIGFARGRAWEEVFLSAVSLAVAAVPEGLPAMVTVALAVGVQRMAKRHVLLRRLPAVETLGCATVICTDKTGTLTAGQMEVREVWGSAPQAVLEAAASCCDAHLSPDGVTGTGDPTEVAILREAARRGILRAEIEQRNPRVDVEPFDAQTRRMSILRADGVRSIKGAVEVILPACGVDPAAAGEAQTQAAALAGRGLRVLAVAQEAPGGGAPALLGLLGLADPPRPEAIEAIRVAFGAGIKTVMITGDHPQTAQAIALEMGILRPGEPPEESVHARATPEDKIKIIRAWKARGAIVAMTGDGVNDAPALREAHVGVAMGKGGTEVTREASDVVLLDDNFASIIAAIHEGRGTFDNIRKALAYLMTGNASELALMLAASLLGLPLPLLPLHLLWINLVSDGLPGLALVMDPTAPDAMQRPPRDPHEPLLNRSAWALILGVGLLEAALALCAYLWVLEERGLEEARGVAFSALVFGQMFQALAYRSSTLTFWGVGATTNLFLLGTVVGSVALQLLLWWLPWSRALFSLAPPTLPDVALALGLGLVPVSLLETAKLLRAWARPTRAQASLPPKPSTTPPTPGEPPPQAIDDPSDPRRASP